MRRVVLLVALVAGCFQSNAIDCADGTVCPASKVCAPAGHACVDPEQVTACEGAAEEDPCTLPVGGGRCRDGICVLAGCGDGTTVAPEVCDDGNTTSGDGCRSDCQKIEMCGDGTVDEGERCDDGNENPSDGCDACVPTQWTPTLILGGPPSATAVGMSNPWGIAVDVDGNVFVADADNNRIRRIDALTQTISTVAGTGLATGALGDGGDATSASLSHPTAVQVDAFGALYIADQGHDRIRKVDTHGVITTFAGSAGTFPAGAVGDGGPATNASLAAPTGIALDRQGGLYIADRDHHRIRKVETDGTIVTVVGTGTAGSGLTQQPATSQLDQPTAVAVDPDSIQTRIYIADTMNQRIVTVELGSFSYISAIAGDGVEGYSQGTSAYNSHVAQPQALVVGSDGYVYIADTNNGRIRGINPLGGTSIVDIIGNLNHPRGIALGHDGRLYISDSGNDRVDVVAPGPVSGAGAGSAATIAGDGSRGYGPDGTAATGYALASPGGAAYDATGRLVISDTGHGALRRVELDGSVTTVATTLGSPRGVAVAGTNIYVADESRHRVHQIDANGAITTIAGTGTAGSAGEGATASSAPLASPHDVAVYGSTIYIADTANNRVRKVVSGVLTTVAGTGAPGYGGDTQAATAALLSAPQGLAVDPFGNLFIADTGNHRIRRVDANSGVITTVAGSSSAGFSGDSGNATLAQLSSPLDVAVGSNGELYIADAGNQRIRKVLAGTISTVAGTSTSGDSGDGANATQASLDMPSALTAAPSGFTLVDTNNGRVRNVDAGGRILTVAGLVSPDGVGKVEVARLADPRAIVHAPTFTLFAAGSSGTVEMLRNSALEAVAGRYLQELATGGFGPTPARFQARDFPAIGGVAYDETKKKIYFTAGDFLWRITRPSLTEDDASTWTMERLYPSDTTQNAFRSLTALYLDGAARRLYVADTGNHAVRWVDIDTLGTTPNRGILAGSDFIAGFSGDGGAAIDARMYSPRGLVKCGEQLYVSDTGNNRVRRIDLATGTITTVLGDGGAASSGQGSPATAYPVDTPEGLACDPAGNLYVTSRTTVRLVIANASGVADGTGDVQTIFGAASNPTLPALRPRCLTGVAAVDAATLELTDCAGTYFSLHREVAP